MLNIGGHVCFILYIFSSVTTALKYTPVEKGTPNSMNYRIFYQNDEGNAISPFHDIPLYANDSQNIYNMIVEMPRWTSAKMEISRDQILNPIHQDIKNGQLRYVPNTFPYHGYIWNYGAFPQTWEYPGHIEPSTKSKGDNDPIDVIEIGSRLATRGEVMQVEVLGIIGLIDEGETDWKVVTINVNDPKASQINDVTDIEKHFPSLLKTSIDWFRIYKIPDGKPENKFAFDGEVKNAAFAVEKVNETHQFWKSLLNKKITSDEISSSNTVVSDSPFLITKDDANVVFAKAAEGGEAQPIPDRVDSWQYISSSQIRIDGTSSAITLDTKFNILFISSILLFHFITLTRFATTNQ